MDWLGYCAGTAAALGRLAATMQSEWPTKHTKGTKGTDWVVNQVNRLNHWMVDLFRAPIPSDAFVFV